MPTVDPTFVRSDYESLFFGEIKKLKQVESSGQNAIFGHCKKNLHNQNVYLDTHLCICFYIALVNRSFKMAYRTVVLCNVNISIGR